MDITLDDQLSALQQISQRKLIEILDIIPGKKDFIIEHKLMKILDSFIGVSTLRQYGVDKIFKYDQGLKPVNVQRVFLVSCDLIACKRVLDQIQSEISLSQELSHHILVTPLIPVALQSLVEEEGLAGLIKLYPLTWEFIRTDDNVLSLEIPLFTDLYYHKDTRLLSSLARSLWSLKLVIGMPNFTIALGKYSHKVLKMIESMKELLGSVNSKTHEIGAMIIMDRSCDFASTLLTPVTYLGLLSEVLDIKLGVASLGNSRLKLDPKKDSVYAEVRDRHFSDAFPTLRTKAKSLKSEQEAVQSMRLDEMKHYVANTLQKTAEVKKQLECHITACEAAVGVLGSEFEAMHSMEKSVLEGSAKKEVLDYIERNIDDRPLRSLRLLSLLSITNDGLSADEVQSIHKSHLHAHGFQNIPLFYKLQNIGFLTYRTDNMLQKLPSRSSKWNINARRFKLLPKSSQSLDLKGPTCPSYVFNGAYVPNIAQILSIIMSQDTGPKILQDLTSLPDCVTKGVPDRIQPKTVLICVVGGITYGEISACRFVEKVTGIQLIITSDCIITGNKLMEDIQNI